MEATGLVDRLYTIANTAGMKINRKSTIEANPPNTEPTTTATLTCVLELRPAVSSTLPAMLGTLPPSPSGEKKKVENHYEATYS
jgi:hypothetical protein